MARAPKADAGRDWTPVHLSGPERLEGEYEAKELDDGELLLIRPLTSYREMLERQGGRRVTGEEFERSFGDLPQDGEG